jgi:hypothetical protein
MSFLVDIKLERLGDFIAYVKAYKPRLGVFVYNNTDNRAVLHTLLPDYYTDGALALSHTLPYSTITRSDKWDLARKELLAAGSQVTPGDISFECIQ